MNSTTTPAPLTGTAPWDNNPLTFPTEAGHTPVDTIAAAHDTQLLDRATGHELSPDI